MIDDALGTVLVVDGDSQVRLLFRTALEAEKYRVVTAESGQHAVNLLAHYGVDVILLDAALVPPEGDDEGEPLVSRLHKAQPGCPIIMMVGQEESGAGFGARSDSPVLEKPCQLDVLLRVVGEQVRMSRTR